MAYSTRIGLAPSAMMGVTGLSLVGFLVHLGPIYRGAAAEDLAGQPAATWPGIGAVALLLSGMLALPA